MTDSEKLEALYKLYERPLYHIAMAVLHQHEQAEDAVHDAYSENAAAADESDALSSPVPYEYNHTCLRSLSLIFSDGTEQEVNLDFGLGSGSTKLSESGQYDCMDIESFATFHRPVSLQNLTAIRINGAEVSLK